MPDKKLELTLAGKGELWQTFEQTCVIDLAARLGQIEREPVAGRGLRWLFQLFPR